MRINIKAWAAIVPRPKTFLAGLLVWGAAACSLVPQAAHTQGTVLPTVELEIGYARAYAELAATPSSRRYGLMGRQHLPADHGMLFVFAEPAQLCFWMKNTPLPLTVAFIDAAGSIVNLADMQPHSLDPHCAIAPALYALEAEQGWFARYGITPGTRVRGLPRLQRRQSE